MSPKSDHFYSFKGIKALKTSHPEVKRLKKESKGHAAHGNKVWRSSFVLVDYFTSYRLEKNTPVLDIGCGWGLSGIFLAKEFQARVTGIDLDGYVEPFLHLQASLNNCEVAFQKKSFQQLTKSQLGAFEVIIGADICFWDELTPVLFKLIRRALKAGVKRIVIADPGRPPFWELADICAEKLNSEVITRTIKSPIKTTKYLLVLGDDVDV